MGTSLVLLVMAYATFSIYALVGLLALGMALISPNLAALVSKRGGRHHLGQAGGPFLGSTLLLWHRNAPYLMAGTLLVVVSVVIGWTAGVRERLTIREPAARKRGA